MFKTLISISIILTSCAQPIQRPTCTVGEIKQFCQTSNFDKSIMICEMWRVDQSCKKLEPVYEPALDEEIESEFVRN